VAPWWPLEDKTLAQKAKFAKHRKFTKTALHERLRTVSKKEKNTEKH